MDIGLSYNLTRNDLFTATLSYYGRLGRVLRTALGAVLLLLGLIVLLAPGSRLLAWFLIPYSALVFFTPRINAWMTVRRYFSNPGLGKNIECRLTDEGTNARTEVGEGSQKWDFYKTWMESPDSFMLIVYKGYFVGLPKRAFASEQDISTLRDFLRSRMGPPKA
jgi:hypothetical protein